jgi:hypothetical protein
MIQLLRVAIVLVLCNWAVGIAKWTPAPVPASAPATEFSSERALKHVRRIAERPHPTGSEALAGVEAYIVGEIRALGLSPQIQEVTAVSTRYPTAGHVRNILVRLPGTRPGGQAVVLVSHYDGVPAGPAAGDAAAAVGALLEALRALRAGPPLTHDVILLLTDSEEQGLLGAAAFAREHPWAKDVGVFLNFEGRGTYGPSFMFETGPGNLDVARKLRQAPDARGTSLSAAVYRLLPNDTDLSELSILGKPAMNFAFVGGVQRYHTSQDDVAHLSVGSVQHHGVQALAMARAFGNDSLPRPVTKDGVFFFFPGLGTFVYPEWFALIPSFLALALVVVAMVRRRKENENESGWVVSILLGFVAGLVTMAVGALFGWGFGATLVRVHATMADGDPRWSETYAAAVMLAVLALTMGLHRLALWKRQGGGAELGALAWWSLVGIAVTIAMPAASFLFTWPLLFAVIAAQRAPAVPIAGGVLHWLAVVVVLLFVAPMAYNMSVTALGLDATGAAILGVLTAMAATLIRPVIVTESDPWWPAGPVLLYATWKVIVGLTTVRSDEEHPVGANLVLAIEADSSRAFVTGGTSGTHALFWLGSSIGAKELPRSALPQWLQRLNGGRPAAVAERFVSPMLPARVTVLKDSSTGGERYVTARVRPGNRNVLGVRMDLDGARVVSTSVDGRAVSTERYRRTPTRWTLDFIAPRDSGFTIELRLADATRPVLNLQSRVSGLVAWPVGPMPNRPKQILPIQSGDVSVVYNSVPLERVTPRRR